jgi:hypothetical protein
MGEGLQRAFAATYGVKVGQFWQDNDPRFRDLRTLRVDAFEPFTHPNGLRKLYALCTVCETGRRIKIQVHRLKPTSNGYRLVKEAS